MVMEALSFMFVGSVVLGVFVTPVAAFLYWLFTLK